MTYKTKLGLALLAVMAVSGCSGAKEKLGLTRHAPDEFAVVKRAPLAMPPDYALRPPRPGQPRPQELDTKDEARAAVIGDTGASTPIEASSKDEVDFLKQAGVTTSDPAVRQKIDAETPAYAQKNKPVVQRILGTGDPEGTANVVNATQEAQRIKNNQQQGRAPTSGETPSVEN